MNISYQRDLEAPSGSPSVSFWVTSKLARASAAKFRGSTFASLNFLPTPDKTRRPGDDLRPISHFKSHRAKCGNSDDDDVLRNRGYGGKIVLPCRRKFQRRDKSFFRGRFGADSIFVQAIRWTRI
jgi:hypothetical protein